MDCAVSRRPKSAGSSIHSKKVIIVENNYSGQFARYLRSETGFAAHGHIRKYDGEPFLRITSSRRSKNNWRGETNSLGSRPRNHGVA